MFGEMQEAFGYFGYYGYYLVIWLFGQINQCFTPQILS